MAGNPLNILRDKLFAKADAQLRARVEEQLGPLRPRVTLVDVEINGATFNGEDLLNKIRDAYLLQHQDDNRSVYIQQFLSTVEKYRQQERSKGRG